MCKLLYIHSTRLSRNCWHDLFKKTQLCVFWVYSNLTWERWLSFRNIREKYLHNDLECSEENSLYKRIQYTVFFFCKPQRWFGLKISLCNQFLKHSNKQLNRWLVNLCQCLTLFFELFCSRLYFLINTGVKNQKLESSGDLHPQWLDHFIPLSKYVCRDKEAKGASVDLSLDF